MTIDQIVAESRRKLTKMITEGNVKTRCFDYYLPSEEAMDSIIKSAIEKQREIDFGWVRQMFKDTLESPATASELGAERIVYLTCHECKKNTLRYSTTMDGLRCQTCGAAYVKVSQGPTPATASEQKGW